MRTTTAHSQTTEHLPAAGIAPVFREVVRLVSDPGTSTARLAAVVSKDRRLATTILKKANSPYYGIERHITDVNVAVILLGFNTLRETVASVVIAEAFRKVVSTVLRFGEFWDHSVACGLAARAIADRYPVVNPESAFVAGLLHDIGALLLENPQDPGNGAGAHAQAGAWLATRWGLPEEIVQAIRWHHDPLRAGEAQQLAAVVYFADILSARRGHGYVEQGVADSIDPVVWQVLGLGESEVTPEVLDAYAAHIDLDLSGVPSFEELVHAMRHKLIEQLERLPADEKLIFILHYYEGLSVEEIGVLIGINEHTAQRRLQAALRRLTQTVYRDVLTTTRV
ncbi:MAG: sigma-70 family RNA polymerase sigma factor [Ignavibacteria bacterium]|nr:sigma-70 family RNA polymerase sigma factor [Ignavibacteria bacterium]